MADNNDNAEENRSLDAKLVSPSPTSSSSVKSKPKRKRRPPSTPWRKPVDMPKRYLSAYNLFYREERERMLRAGKASEAPLSEGGANVTKEEGVEEDPCPPMPHLPDPDTPKNNASRKHARSSGIGFANLTRIVAERWKNLDPALRGPYEEVAKKDKERYQKQMVLWRAEQRKKKESKDPANDEKGATPVNWNPTSSPSHHFFDPYASPPILSESGRGQQRDHRSTINMFGSPSHGVPGGNVPELLTPERNPTERKPATDRDFTQFSSPRRNSEPLFRSGSSFDLHGECNQGPGSGGQSEYLLAHWGGYKRYGHPPGVAPYAMHGPGPYPYVTDEGHPSLARHRSLPHSRYSNSDTSHRYASYRSPPEYGFYDAGMPPQSSIPRYPAQQFQAERLPHAYAFNPPYPYPPPQSYPRTTSRVHEQTVQLLASPNEFEVPRSSSIQQQPTDDTKKHKRQKPSSSIEAASAMHEEECSFLESSFGHIDDANLDRDTVDFLTKLELE